MPPLPMNTNKMKAVFLLKKKEFEVRDIPRPRPKEKEVLIRVKVVGVCGSDVHYYLEGKIGSQQIIKEPLILGHELSGEVAELGKGAGNFKVGQRVVVEPAISCGKCEVCRKGWTNICPLVKFLGTPPVNGAFCEYLVMPGENLFPLPDKLSDEEGVMFEPLAIGLYAVRLSRFLPGETVAILGSGPIGLVTLLSARAAGASLIFATDIIPERLKAAKKIGAREVFNPEKEDVAEKIMELTKGRGVDVTFEAAGKEETINQAFAITALGGRVMIIGIPEVDAITYEPHQMRRKELLIQNVRHSLDTTGASIRLVEEGLINLKPLITHCYPFDKITEAFELVSHYQDGVIKAVIKM